VHAIANELTAHTERDDLFDGGEAQLPVEEPAHLLLEARVHTATVAEARW
jgi:hypothetical protein